MIPSLPLPLVSALVLAFLLAVLLLRRGPPGFFVALVGLCAVQAAVIALAQHYGIAAFRSLQPVTAAAIPPLAWAAFQFSAVRRPRLPHDLANLAGPVLVAAASVAMPALFDALIPALFLGYGGMILLAAWRGADGLPRLPFEVGDTPGLVWKVIALSLIVSALGDGLIAAAAMGGRADWLPWIVRHRVLAHAARGRRPGRGAEPREGRARPGPEGPPPPIPDDLEADKQLMARLDALLESRRLYLDPELTLTRLARALHVPVKRLSAAINRSTGGNVSRHVNAYRIRDACRALEGGASVTDAMLASGFNTKSNFNREFRRVTGSTPSARRGVATSLSAKSSTISNA